MSARQYLQRRLHYTLYLLLIAVYPVWPGTTGKIAGIVTDSETGEPLPGANVTVQGTTLGAAADMAGNYTILYVPPGEYSVQFSMIGYAKVTVTGVRVRIDQTARVNMVLQMEAIEGESVIVVADRNIIKPDVATSVVEVTTQEMEELPVSSVENVVGLQAGIQGDLQIRGGQAAEALFLVDGVTLRDPRNNRPISNIALSAIKEISVERGGFNAEYGQVRAGIVNVVTREGGKSDYHGKIEFRYSPPAAKYFGTSPFDENSYWLRPYYDDEVCWTGTASGAWDEYKQRQYPDFEGWNAVSRRLLSDNDPNNDLSPLGAQRLFMWETRKQPQLDQPDYLIDAGFGGPVPVIGEKLGSLRFFTSYRRNREMLVVPLSRDDYVDNDWTLKLTSDLSPSMKLTVSGLLGKQYTMQDNWSSSYLRWSGNIAGVLADSPGDLFGTGIFSLVDIDYKTAAAKLTHMLSKHTFYEISLEHLTRDYFARPTAYRDLTQDNEIIDDFYVDETPFGYVPENNIGIVGFVYGGFSCKRRDKSRVSATSLKADLTSQINFSNLVKAGLELVYNDLDFDYGTIANYSDERYEQHVLLDAQPVRAALYIQDKLETKGFIMNAGLRFDYSNSNTDWWDVDPFDRYFFGTKYDETQEFNRKKSEAQWQLSPRLGISHPITENSKLFFNYGHFKQMPSYETLFNVGRRYNNQIQTFGDPNLVLAKTISYELGYDQTLFEDYLIQVAGFYRDIFDQQNTIHYTAISDVEYDLTANTSYADIRGVELTLRKRRGRWWTFFGNYTYQVTSRGHFGRENIYQDPTEQKRYDEATVNLYQERPLPQPYARLNLTLYTPDNFGPGFYGLFPAGGYIVNLLMNWQAGPWVTWNPKNISSIRNNIQQTNYFNAVLRFSKTFNVSKFKIQAFVDIDNLFNYKRMSLANFGPKGDREFYYNSLHLP